jgi:hypothetical protein
VISGFTRMLHSDMPLAIDGSLRSGGWICNATNRWPSYSHDDRHDGKVAVRNPVHWNLLGQIIVARKTGSI